MSIRPSVWRRELKADPKLTPMQKLCGWELSLHAWAEPVGYSRRHEDLAADLGIAVRSVERALDALDEGGYLEVIRRGQKWQQQVYELTVPDAFSPTARSG